MFDTISYHSRIAHRALHNLSVYAIVLADNIGYMASKRVFRFIDWYKDPLARASIGREALLCGTGAARERCQMLPHLLVVGARNSFDHGPARHRHEAKRGARHRRRRNRRSCCIRCHRYFSTPTLHVQALSSDELPYKGGTCVTRPRRGSRGLHRHNGAFPQVCGGRSRPCLAKYKTCGSI